MFAPSGTATHLSKPIVSGLIVVFSCFSALMMAGCRRAEEIGHYTVESADPAADRSEGSTDPAMLLGAIIPHGGQTWFFKATGTPTALEGEVDAFDAFLRSIRFPKDAPEWTVPDHWQQQPGSGMRHATLRLGRDGPELSVIALPTPDDQSDYLLSNINRWREQIQLEPLSPDQLATESEVVPLDGFEATVVRMNGRQPATERMSTVGRSMLDSLAPASHFEGDFMSSPSESSIECSPPDEWSPSRVGGMRKAAYSVARDGQQVEITVIDLSADVAEILPNVNRWREQVQLEETTAEALAKEITAIDAGEVVGNYVKLVGPETAEPQQTILAVVALHSGRAWFFKLFGDTKLAAEEQERFETFVRSVQFRNP